MQNNYPINAKEQQQRTMMRSLILPDQITQNKSNQLQTVYYNQRKIQNNQSFTPNYSQYQNSYKRSFQKERIVQNNSRSPLPYNKEININQLLDRVDRLTKTVQKHEKHLLNIEKPQQLNNHSINTETIVQETLNQLKKPNFLKQIFTSNSLSYAYNTEIYQHIFNVKLQINSLKQQLAKGVKRWQSELLASEQRIKEELSYNNVQIKRILKDFDDKIQKKTKNQSMNLKNSMVSINPLQNEEVSSFLFKIQQQINQMKSQLQNKLQFSISPIKSSMPPIMLKYQEIFRVKQHSNIIINQSLYYIDSEGCLLDHQSRYILDLIGNKIKLLDKHLIILKSAQIIK